MGGIDNSISSKNIGHLIKAKVFPEANIDGFTRLDGTLLFYSKVNSILRDTDIVLDFGAGRGANISECTSSFLKRLQIFKGRCSRVYGCDVDPVVKQNPYIDEAEIQSPGSRLPYNDDFFDLIVSSWVFEHVENPEKMAEELVRILKPGGYICARTPNKFGYIALFSRMAANKMHKKLLRSIQPDKKDEDTFPTNYKMNSRGDINRLFGKSCDVLVFSDSADPSYHFNNIFLYRMFKFIHKITPRKLATTNFIFLRKRG